MAELYDLLAQGKVKREEFSDGVGFVIVDNELFSENGLIMLDRERHSGFLKCSKYDQNGSVCLKYTAINSDCRPLQSLLSQMTADRFVRCLINLKSIFDIINFDINNGFFIRNNVAMSFNDIYVDIGTGLAYIIYIPLQSSVNDDACEYLLGREILNAVGQYVNICNTVSMELCQYIQHGMPTFQAIAEISGKYRIKSDNYEIISPKPSSVVDYHDYRREREERNLDNRRDFFEPNSSRQPGNSQLTSTGEFSDNLFQQSSAQLSPQYSDNLTQYDDTATQIIINTGLYLISKKRGIEFPLNYGANTVGRNSNVDIDLKSLGNNTISHLHATIYVDSNKKISVMDNSSKNGTSIVVKGFARKSRVLRLIPNRNYPVIEGNYLVLANEEFVVVRK